MSRSQVNPVGPSLTKQLEGLARSLARDADPEDLVQETLLQHHLRGDEARDSVVWAKQVLRNCFRMRVRGGRRRRQRETTAAELAQQCQTGPLGGDAPLDHWLDQEAFIEALNTALAQLDEPFRSVIQARFYDRLSAKEIAERNHVAAGTVRWQTHEGLRRLRETLDRRFHSRELWLATLLATLAPNRVWALDSATRRVPSESTMPNFSTTVAKPVLLTLFAGALAGGLAMQTGATNHAPHTLQTQTTSTSPELQPAAAHEIASSHHAPATTERPADPRTKRLLNRVAQNLAKQPEPATRAEPPNADDQPTCEFAPEADCDCPFAADELNDIDPADELDESELIPDVPKQLEDVERIHLTTTGLAHIGPGTKTFTIVECGDFQCPFCEEARSVINILLKDNPGIDYYYAHNPLKFHKQAAPAAKAAVYVQRQHPELYWRFFELIFDHQLTSTSDILDIGAKLGIDRSALAAGINNRDIIAEVERQAQLCRDNKARGTPTFFVEGIRVPGARPVEQMQRLIDRLSAVSETNPAQN